MPQLTKALCVVQHWLDRATLLLNIVGTLLIIALALLVNGDVIGRTVFGSPLAGVPELVSLSIVAIVFLQIAYTFRAGRMTRTDLVPQLAAAHSPRAEALLSLVLVCGALFVLYWLFSASMPHFERAWQRGTFVGSIGDFTAPEWPIKLIILVGTAALSAQILMRAVWAVVTLITGARAPVQFETTNGTV